MLDFHVVRLTCTFLGTDFEFASKTNMLRAIFAGASQPGSGPGEFYRSGHYRVSTFANRPEAQEMDKDYLLLKHAALSRPSGQWNDDDFDVLANGEVVSRIYKANAAPVGSPWMWTLAFGHHEGRSPTPIHSRNIC
jgi:hypothetical protein